VVRYTIGWRCNGASGRGAPQPVRAGGSAREHCSMARTAGCAVGPADRPRLSWDGICVEGARLSVGAAVRFS
jgi:hypothetical protein